MNSFCYLQLVDFREVVARMLGLNVTSLAIPDYEIISRLEKFIKKHQLGVATSAALERSMQTMDPGFQMGYTEGMHSSQLGLVDHYSKSRKSLYRGRSRSHERYPSHHTHRHRSLSPRRSTSPRRCTSPKRY